MVRSLVAASVLLGSRTFGAPFLEYLFTGSGANEAAILTEGSLPIIGGGWGCGRYNEGFPVCALRDPDQECCAHDIKPPNLGPGGGVFDLSGQTITIGVSAVRGTGDYFIEWLGVCRPPPVPCVPGPSAPWCQGGLDYRNPPSLTCTLTLPSNENVQVITHWESEVDDHLPTCDQNQVLTGTCTVLATTTTTSTTTTTVPFDKLPKFKQDAVLQMRRELQQLLYPCLVASTGVALFAVPQALAVAATVGTTMIGVAAPVCAKEVQLLLELRKVYDDPPDPAYDRIARVQPTAKPPLGLPSCTGLKGRDRVFCRRLERAARRWVDAVSRVESVAAALETAANRLGAAHAASANTAAKKQERAANRLANRLAAAVGARSNAGAHLAAVLRSVGTTGMLTEPQSAQAADVVLGQLAAQGFTEDAARALFGSALTPSALDLLGVLAQP